MSKAMIFIFFDDVMREYQNYYADEWENKLIEDLKKYLKELSKKSLINIITRQNVADVKNWCSKNNLHIFIDSISS